MPSSDEDKLIITQRNLPHWTFPGSAYFITFRTRSGELDIDERQIVQDSIMHFHDQRYIIFASVVMPDHVHLLLQPIKNKGKDFELAIILKGIKGFSAREINKKRNKKGSVWLAENFDRIIRNEKEFTEKWNYIRNNPVKSELSLTPEDYDFLWEPVEA